MTRRTSPYEPIRLPVGNQVNDESFSLWRAIVAALLILLFMWGGVVVIALAGAGG